MTALWPSEKRGNEIANLAYSAEIEPNLMKTNKGHPPLFGRA
jgi:hypothetical protein